MPVVETPPGYAARSTEATAAAFLPLTLSAIQAFPAGPEHPELGVLADRAVEAERAASDSWQALLGDCACAGRQHFPDHLRRLSEAARDYTGERWQGSAHPERVAEFEVWAAEALIEGDGAEFAEACAGYDAALAHALVTVSGPPSVPTPAREPAPWADHRAG